MTDEDLDLAQSLIDKLPPGEYEIEQFFAEFWEAIPIQEDRIGWEASADRVGLPEL